ncbi:MAG: lipoate--protein ligase [Clostridia bacterium]|nr:lipoate--protein ligase [Clostridia bacterium]
MRSIFNPCTDPYFNIASDEYILDASRGDVFMLWRNSPSVIIGKNQNAWGEVNVPYVTEEGIPVVRRITGGGAVFHDLGNVNFSFVTRADDSTKLNFEKFTRPIISALASLGVNASLDGRNDLVANGFKISGNAECVKKNRYGDMMLLHHGTLLFGADMSRLASALRVDPEKIASKGIKSVRSRVKNISELDCYTGPRDVGEFIERIMSEVGSGEACGFTEAERSEIDERRRGKFATWEWNFGASPSFETKKKVRFPFGTVEINFTCREGRISDIKIFGDFFGTEDVSSLEQAVLGERYERGSVSSRLDRCRGVVASCIEGASPDDIAEVFFR